MMITDFEPKSKDVISSFFYQEDDGYTYEVKLCNFESIPYLYVWITPDSGYVYVKAVNQSKCKKIQELIEEQSSNNKNNKKLFETIKGMIESSN